MGRLSPSQKNYVESPEECSGLRGIVLVEREVEAIRKRPLIILILLCEKVASLTVIFLRYRVSQKKHSYKIFGLEIMLFTCSQTLWSCRLW